MATVKRVALSTRTSRPLHLTFKAFAFLLLLGALPTGFVAIPAWAAEELFVANFTNHSITVYPRTQTGGSAPLRSIIGSATELNAPVGLALDFENNELFVSNDNNSITVYDLTGLTPGNNDVPPIRTISGGLTALNGPRGLAIDPANELLFVVNYLGNSITVYDLTGLTPGNNNVAPIRTISGGLTTLFISRTLALDLDHNELFVGNGTPGTPPGLSFITVYDLTTLTSGNNNVAPIRTISGTALSGPRGLALDLTPGVDELFVVNRDNDSITVYPRTQNDGTAPLRTISGGSTGLLTPAGLALDLTHGELFVANFGDDSIPVYPRTQNDGTAPLRTISGGSTGLSDPTDVVFADTTPNAFTFTDVTGVALSTVQTSNAITVSGINGAPAISIVGGEYELNSSGTWSSSSPTTVANGDTVRVRHTSAATDLTAVNTTLTIGGISDTFTSTTGDTTPNVFTFTDVTGVALSTVQTSTAITVSGITAPAAISITACTSTSCEYAINGGTWTGASGTVNNGQTVQVRHTSAATPSTAVNTTLTIGGVADTFTSTTLDDTTPNAFTFTDVTGVALSTVQTSTAITVSGITIPTAISVVGGEYEVNSSGTWSSSPTTVATGDTVRVRHTSAATPSTAVNTTLTIGGVADTFTSTTLDDTTPDAFTFTDVTGVALSTVQTSNDITVSGITGPAPISVVGGEYEVNGSGTWTTIAGTVANGDTVLVRHTSAATPSTAVDTTLTIGGVSDTFTSVTLGTAKLGVFRGTNWFLDLNGNGAWDGCGTDGCILNWGAPGDSPVVGDWTGTGTAKLGVFRNGDWFLDLNGNGAWDGCGTDGCIFGWGAAGDSPVAGRW